MFIADHDHILNVIDSCINPGHTTTCYCWIFDMYKKNILEFKEFCEYSEIIYEKEMVIGSNCDSIPICVECTQ